MPVDSSHSNDADPSLSRRRRQHVLFELEEADTPITIDALADRMVEWERDRSGMRSAPDRLQIREELHDRILPALDDQGLVDFDAAEGLVGEYDADSDVDTGDRRETEPESDVRAHVALAVVGALALTVAAAVLFDPVTAAVVAGIAVTVATVAVAANSLRE